MQEKSVAELAALVAMRDRQIQQAVQVLLCVDRKSTEWGVVEYAIHILQPGQNSEKSL